VHPNDEDVISLGPDDDEDEEFGDDFAPGPDERDMDLLDGTWEERYYAGQARGLDWGTIALAIALLVVIALVLPGVLVVLR
jgi:hypothetical protein